MNRTCPFPSPNSHFIIYLDFYLCKRCSRISRLWLFTYHLVIYQIKKWFIFSKIFCYQKIKTCIRTFKLVAVFFKHLNFFQNCGSFWTFLCKFWSNFVDFCKNRRPTRNFAKQNHAIISNSLWFYMLISQRIFQNCVSVHSSLVSKSICSNVGHSLRQSDIRNLC